MDELSNYSKNLTVQTFDKNIKPSFHLFVININFKKIKKTKDYFIKYFVKKKIFTQQHYIPSYKIKIYDEIAKKFPGSEKYIKNSISIPIFVGLTLKQQNKIIKTIKKLIKT